MKKALLLFLSITLPYLTSVGQNPYPESPYSADDPTLPDWVRMMYGSQPNILAIDSAYRAYYAEHEFTKNEHTQYYKRWSRDKWMYMKADGSLDLPTAQEAEKSLTAYVKKVTSHIRQSKASTGGWEELGPWEYDHEKTMEFSVQSPGAAHVYAVEQSASNPDIIWAATANAGLWKSIDKGISWTCMTTAVTIKNVYSLEIDHSDADVVYAYSGSRIWKTTDGGTTWAASGNDQYFSWTRDIIMHPTDSNILLAATTEGLFRSEDGATTWTKLKGGHWQEIEWHPVDPSIVYAVKSIDNRTECYKATDGGTSFSIRPSGWPGIASSTTSGLFTANELSLGGHATFTDVLLGGTQVPDFTIDLRIKLSSWSGDPSIISNKNWSSGYNNGYVLACSGNAWKFNIGDGSNRIDLNGNILNDDEWHHIAISYDQDGKKKVYHDGEAVDSTDVLLSTIASSGWPLRLMQDGTGSYAYDLTGQIAEVRLWTAALGDAEVADLACGTVDSSNPNYSDLMHHWRIDEGSGSSLSDSKGSNTGTISGGHTWVSQNEMTCLDIDHHGGENKRVEIAVSPAAPNSLYVLASGSAHGSSGLYGFYKSTNAGEDFTFTCCGGAPGGTPTANNPNLMGYAYDLTSAGGQYYYDMSLAVSPTDSNKIFAAGISVIRSEDGGVNWETNGHWVTWVGPNTKQRYTHADVHDVKFFYDGAGQADLWTASDGGLFYSDDEGDHFQPRMHGIQGTEFWGFGGSYKEDAMIGGTYHNGTLVHFNDLYPKGKNGHGGWIALGAADQTFGYTHDGDGSKFFHEGGLRKISSRDQYWKALPFDNSKIPNYSGAPGRFGNYEWHPYYYEEYYSPRDEVLYKTEDDGATWSVVHTFTDGPIYRVRIAASDPNRIYVIQDHASNGKRLWKSENGGQTFVDITPSDALTGNNNWRHKNFDIDHDNPDNIWVLITGNADGYKVLSTTDGGTSWTNMTTPMLDDEYVLDISHHQGTDGGVYVGTTRTMYYKNNALADWVLYNTNLPLLTRCGYIYPYYTEGKVRVGTYRGAYQADFYEDAPPTARIGVDKKSSQCSRDTFYFKDLSYVQHDNISWQWTFENGTPATSTEEQPKVRFPEGSHDVSLTVTNAHGSATMFLPDLVTIGNSDCDIERIPDQAMQVKADVYANIGRPDELDFDGVEPYTFMAWIMPTQANQNGYILTKYDRYVAGQFQLGIENGRLVSHREKSPWQILSSSTLAVDEWTHVATTYDGAILKIYINGQEDGSIAIGSINAINKDLLIGARHRSGNVNDHFLGNIEELSIWNKALSLDEIRLLRHLTLDKIDDSGLVSYYQFNEVGDTIYDRVGFNHARFFNATRVASDAPVGGGASELMSVYNAGSYNFDSVGVTMDFPSGGVLPDGDLVISRIEIDPNILPGTSSVGETYWIVNNYGNNTLITSLNSLVFKNINHLTPNVQAAELSLYMRHENSHTDSWMLKGGGQSIDSLQQAILYDAGVQVNQFGQFAISNDHAKGWIGVENTDWDNPKNWGGGIIPDQSSDVIIPSNTPFQPVVNINAQVASILLLENASLGIKDGVVFEVID